MNAVTGLTARLAHAGRAARSWVDDTASGRQKLAQERIRNGLLEARLSEQLDLNGQLLAARQGAAGGAG
jgi:hypothetical protein